MSELTNSNVENINFERSSLSISDTARTPLSVTRCDNESLYAESMVGLGPSYQGCDSFDVCLCLHVKMHRVRSAMKAPHLMTVMTLLAKRH